VNHWGRRQLVYERDYTYGAPQITGNAVPTPYGTRDTAYLA